MSMTTKIVLDPETGEQIEVEMDADERAAHDALIAAQATHRAGQRFAVQEDAERLALVAERALADPAFAALAELTLGRKGL